MRRRRRVSPPRSAVELVELYARVRADAAALDVDSNARAQYVREVLEVYGTDPLEAMRARYWLRRGRTDEGWRDL